MEQEQFKYYFNHVLGINLFNIWCNKNNPTITSADGITCFDIPLHLNNKFCIRLKMKQNKFEVYFAAERDEFCWLKRIDWERFVLDINNNTLYLVSQFVQGDFEKVPDFATFMLKFHFDFKNKIKVFKKLRNVQFKELLIDDEEILLSDTKKSVPLYLFKNDGSRMLERKHYQKANTFKNIIERNIQKSFAYANTQYKEGTFPTVIADSNLRALLEPFDERKAAEQAKQLGTNFEVMPDFIRDITNKDFDYNYQEEARKEKLKKLEEQEEYNNEFEFH